MSTRFYNVLGINSFGLEFDLNLIVASLMAIDSVRLLVDSFGSIVIMGYHRVNAPSADGIFCKSAKVHVKQMQMVMSWNRDYHARCKSVNIYYTFSLLPMLCMPFKGFGYFF